MNFSKLNSLLDWSVRVGKLFGIPISLHITILFFLWPVLSGRGLPPIYALEFTVLIVLSILLHELGHALMAKKYKLTGISIMLHGFGGFATSSGIRTPSQALAISLAGPAVTFAIGFVCLVATFGFDSRLQFGTEAFAQMSLIHYLGRLNIILGIMNLIPSLPFDGGQSLVAILNRKLSYAKSFRAVGHVGLIITPIIAIYALVAKDNFIFIFGLMGIIASVTSLLQSGGIRFGEFMADRKESLAMQAQVKKEKARSDAYNDEVKSREKEREEKERLRKMFEVVDGDK